jgi:hypothetical protein
VVTFHASSKLKEQIQDCCFGSSFGFGFGVSFDPTGN